MSDRHQAQAYPLRLPDELKAKVAEAAKANGRSLNSEIINRLQLTFSKGPGTAVVGSATMAQALDLSGMDPHHPVGGTLAKRMAMAFIEVYKLLKEQEAKEQAAKEQDEEEQAKDKP